MKELILKQMEKEKCVNCGKQTDINKNENINNRYYYIEGAGQLCKECYVIIYACT